MAKICAVRPKFKIKNVFTRIPSGAIMFKPDTLNGRSRLGSLKRRIHTAKQTIVKANKVPKLVISPNKEIGVNPATTETTAPTRIVDFQGVFKVG